MHPAPVVLFTISVFAQDAPKNWKNEDLAKDKVYGTSSDLGASQLLKGKPSKTVIVAVVDGGVDVNHPDLKGQTWVKNPKEIPDNNLMMITMAMQMILTRWSFIGGKERAGC